MSYLRKIWKDVHEEEENRSSTYGAGCEKEQLAKKLVKKIKTKQEMKVKIHIDSLNKFSLKWNQTRYK